MSETHVDPGADAPRDTGLSAIGYRLVRVTDGDVMHDVDGMLEQLLSGSRASIQRRHSPHYKLSPAGEGLSG